MRKADSPERLKIERYRLRSGLMGSDPSLGNNGAFIIPGPKGARLQVVISDGHGWEHASVTMANERKMRTPTWEEMCFVKELFWQDDETVIQFHPAKSEYINVHPFVLHLWRKLDETVELPERILV